MVIFTRSVTKWAFIRDISILMALYFGGLAFLPRQVFLSAVNGMLVCIAILTCILYAPSMVSFHHRGATRAAMIRCGIIGAWGITAMQAVARIYFIEFRPDITGRTFDASVGLPALAYIVFAALHVLAIGMEENRPERRNQCFVFWVLIVGLAFPLLLAALHR